MLILLKLIWNQTKIRYFSPYLKFIKKIQYANNNLLVKVREMDDMFIIIPMLHLLIPDYHLIYDDWYEDFQLDDSY